MFYHRATGGCRFFLCPTLVKLRILHLSQTRSYSTTPKKRLNFHLFLANQFVKEGNERAFRNQVALGGIACKSIWFLRFLFCKCSASHKKRMVVAFEDILQGKLARVHPSPASRGAFLIVRGHWKGKRKEKERKEGKSKFLKTCLSKYGCHGNVKSRGLIYVILNCCQIIFRKIHQN